MLTVHVTNSNARVAVCDCGWTDIVHPLRKYQDHKTKRWRYDVAAAVEACEAEWYVHAKLVHVPLVPPDPARAVETVTRRGRWGHS
jgi:hypothetical protein